MNLVSFFPTFKLKFYLAKVKIRPRFDAMQNVMNQRKALFQGGDVWNTRLLHLLLHQRRSWTALFCVFRENKKIPISLKIGILRCFAFLCCGATRIRTGDTRIFSPMLYLLSYGTISELRCKSTGIFFNYQANCAFFSSSRCFYLKKEYWQGLCEVKKVFLHY